MKITSAKLFLAEYNRSETPEFPKKSKVVGIRIYTDEGIYGDGEVAGIHATYGAFGVIKDMWPFISGKDPFDNEVLWDQLMLRTFWGQNGGAFWYSAVSAIDIALWDIKSKALNVPLYKLLGGKRRDKVRYPLGFLLAALCHDFGKAVCTTEIDGVIHSYGHETAGLPLVQQFLERITTETKLIQYVLNMTELHMQPNIMAAARSRLKSTNKLLDRAVEPFDLIQLSVCDGLGKLPPCGETESFLMQRYEQFTAIMARPYVMGKDLIAAGLQPGVQFSEILSYAHKLRLAGIEKENALRQSLAYARKMRKENPDAAT